MSDCSPANGERDLCLDRRETNSFTLLIKLVLQQKTKLAREEHFFRMVGERVLVLKFRETG